ncbi:MAG: ComF family protein, partial [Alphaproteobacteria bacterium]
AGEALLADADAVTPVPLHRLRLFARRYNQAALLGRELGRIAGVPFAPDLLVRTRHTRSQAGRSRRARFENVRGAFAVRRGEDVRGRRIVLVDDVMTTGATAGACAAVLKRAGAVRVDVLSVARVVPGRD